MNRKIRRMIVVIVQLGRSRFMGSVNGRDCDGCRSCLGLNLMYCEFMIFTVIHRDTSSHSSPLIPALASDTLAMGQKHLKTGTQTDTMKFFFPELVLVL